MQIECANESRGGNMAVKLERSRKIAEAKRALGLRPVVTGDEIDDFEATMKRYSMTPAEWAVFTKARIDAAAGR